MRRIPELNQKSDDGQGTLFDAHRSHAFFTTSTLDTVTADKTHRGPAIIEQVHADLKNSAIAPLPPVKFTANAAWLVLATIAFNLTCAVGTLTGSTLAKATTGTISRKLISTWPRGSPPQPGASPCTCPGTGPGKANGQPCSPSTPGPPSSSTT